VRISVMLNTQKVSGAVTNVDVRTSHGGRPHYTLQNLGIVTCY
jgi:hypothetical protein